MSHFWLRVGDVESFDYRSVESSFSICQRKVYSALAVKIQQSFLSRFLRFHLSCSVSVCMGFRQIICRDWNVMVPYVMHRLWTEQCVFVMEDSVKRA